MSWRSRWQISSSASHNSGSSRMLVLPRPATTLRLINRLPGTAAPCLVMPTEAHDRPKKWLSGGRFLSYRQRSCLQTLHGKAAGYVAQRHGADQASVEIVVCGDIRHDHVQQVVDVAAHAPGVDDLRHAPHHVGEALQPFAGVIGSFHRDEYRNGQADLDRVDGCYAAADYAVLLHAADAFPAGRGGEADLAGDVCQRERGIGREEAEDLAIDAVQVFVSGHCVRSLSISVS